MRGAAPHGAADPLGDGPVPEVVDVVVVLPHPVVLRVLGEDLVDPLDPALLVQLEVVARLHLLQRRAEHGELGAQGVVDGRRADDVAAHAVAVTGQRQGVRVDAAGAVQQGVPRRTAPVSSRWRTAARAETTFMVSKRRHTSRSSRRIRSGLLDRLRDVLVHFATPGSGKVVKVRVAGMPLSSRARTHVRTRRRVPGAAGSKSRPADRAAVGDLHPRRSHPAGDVGERLELRVAQQLLAAPGTGRGDLAEEGGVAGGHGPSQQGAQPFVGAYVVVVVDPHRQGEGVHGRPAA